MELCDCYICKEKNKSKRIEELERKLKTTEGIAENWKRNYESRYKDAEELRKRLDALTENKPGGWIAIKLLTEFGQKLSDWMFPGSGNETVLSISISPHSFSKIANEMGASEKFLCKKIGIRQMSIRLSSGRSILIQEVV